MTAAQERDKLRRALRRIMTLTFDDYVETSAALTAQVWRIADRALGKKAKRCSKTK